MEFDLTEIVIYLHAAAFWGALFGLLGGWIYRLIKGRKRR